MFPTPGELRRVYPGVFWLETEGHASLMRSRRALGPAWPTIEVQADTLPCFHQETVASRRRHCLPCGRACARPFGDAAVPSASEASSRPPDYETGTGAACERERYSAVGTRRRHKHQRFPRGTQRNLFLLGATGEC